LYVVVFDSEKMKRFDPACLSYVKGWVDYLRFYLPDAKVVLVGTFLEDGTMENDVSVVNTVIHEKILGYQDLKTVRKSGDLWFHPLQYGTPKTIVNFHESILTDLEQMDDVQCNISIRWLHCFDELQSAQKVGIRFLPFDNVMECAALFGINSSKEVKSMLGFFNDTGLLCYSSLSETTKKIVIMDAECFTEAYALLTSCRQATSGMRELVNSAGLSKDFDHLCVNGIVSQDLLDYMWRDLPVRYLMEMLTSEMLLHSWIIGVEKQFIVSGLLRTDPLPLGISSELRASSTFEFQHEFMPSGLFERLASMCASQCATTKAEKNPVCCESWTLQQYGSKTFLLRKHDRAFSLHVATDNEIPFFIRILTSILRKINAESYSGKLEWRVLREAKAGGEICPEETKKKNSVKMIDLNHFSAALG